MYIYVCVCIYVADFVYKTMYAGSLYGEFPVYMHVHDFISYIYMTSIYVDTYIHAYTCPYMYIYIYIYMQKIHK